MKPIEETIVSIRSFFEVPATKLKAEVKGASPKLEIYEYPGLFMKKDEGDARVRKRLKLPAADPLRGGPAFDELVEACLSEGQA